MTCELGSCLSTFPMLPVLDHIILGINVFLLFAENA